MGCRNRRLGLSLLVGELGIIADVISSLAGCHSPPLDHPLGHWVSGGSSPASHPLPQHCRRPSGMDSRFSSAAESP